MTNIKTEFMALDKHLSRACAELQATEDDIQSLIHSTNDEELFGMLMELDTIVSRYNDIDEMRETIKKRLGIND
jgi:hypothetical protein